jgi:hypothetical protein
VVTSVLLRCTTPAGTGAADVVVTNGVGASTPGLTSVFTYVEGVPAPAPPAPQATVSSFAPTYGATGSTVALKGANLNLVSKVEFTGAESPWVVAPKFLTVNASRLVVTGRAGHQRHPHLHVLSATVRLLDRCGWRRDLRGGGR